jgi:CheY-like chemotaxis protein
MPVMNGLELLDILKISDKYRHIPVVMFTSSSSNQDVLMSYRKYASSYLIKPYLDAEYHTLFNGLNMYWLKLATLPN